MPIKLFFLHCFIYINILIVNGQKNIDSLKFRLIKELSEENTIYSKHIGPVGVLSEFYKKADTLNQLMSIEERKTLLNTSKNYVIKYYSFLSTLYCCDSLAEQLLKNIIQDSSEVFTHFNCVLSSNKFNELLFTEYYEFLIFKYQLGGRAVFHGVSFYSPIISKKAQRKQWKNKKKQFETLVKSSDNKHLTSICNFKY